MRIGRKVALLAGILFALLIIIWLSYDRIAIFAISKYTGVKIDYSSLYRNRVNEFVINGLELFDPKRDIGLSSNKGKFKLIWDIFAPARLGIVFRLEEVRFNRREDPYSEKMDSVSRLLAIPFENRWEHKEISGEVWIDREEIRVRDFMAVSSDTKVSLEGSIYENDAIEVSLTVHLSENILAEIPEEIHAALLKETTGGWRTLSVSLGGNYRIPSIQLVGKKFSLKIKQK